MHALHAPCSALVLCVLLNSHESGVDLLVSSSGADSVASLALAVLGPDDTFVR